VERRERRDFNFRIKGGVSDSGTFTGLAAVFGNTDLGGDSIIPGAFARTLQASKQFPLLWQHNSDEPIGTVQCVETSQGLQVNGALLLKVPQAATAYELLKAGVLRGLSIGYTTIQESFEDGVRLLKELKLYEASIVTFPMNESAMITSVKAMSDSERSKHLKSIDDHRKAIDRHQRGMRMNLKALFGNDLFGDDDEEVDDQALVDDDGEGEMLKAFEVELQKFGTQVRELAK
jgi:HK97 family phage prohead protease